MGREHVGDGARSHPAPRLKSSPRIRWHPPGRAVGGGTHKERGELIINRPCPREPSGAAVGIHPVPGDKAPVVIDALSEYSSQRQRFWCLARCAWHERQAGPATTRRATADRGKNAAIAQENRRSNRVTVSLLLLAQEARSCTTRAPAKRRCWRKRRRWRPGQRAGWPPPGCKGATEEATDDHPSPSAHLPRRVARNGRTSRRDASLCDIGFACRPVPATARYATVGRCRVIPSRWPAQEPRLVARGPERRG